MRLHWAVFNLNILNKKSPEIGAFICDPDGIRTRDHLRDRQVF